MTDYRAELEILRPTDKMHLYPYSHVAALTDLCERVVVELAVRDLMLSGGFDRWRAEYDAKKQAKEKAERLGALLDEALFMLRHPQAHPGDLIDRIEAEQEHAEPGATP